MLMGQGNRVGKNFLGRAYFLSFPRGCWSPCYGVAGCCPTGFGGVWSHCNRLHGVCWGLHGLRPLGGVVGVAAFLADVIFVLPPVENDISMTPAKAQPYTV